ncbi:MAG: acyl carrier protein [Chloroflexi bacterium]|nr:acyl carrier protein [Chloroflexota bacterium]MCL5947445.1 acyl carrier protein [Chloroflexota bacterium]
MSDEIFNKMRPIIARELSVDENSITPEMSLVENLKADSLATMSFIMTIEDEFGISIPPEDAEKIQTVQDAIDYVQAKVG